MKTTPSSTGELRRLWRLIAPFKTWIFCSIISMLGYNVFNAAPAFYAKDILDALGEDIAMKNYVYVGGGIVVVFGLKGFFAFGQGYTMGFMVQKILLRLRSQLFEHLQNLSLSFFAKQKTGDLMARFTNDLQILQAALNVGITGPFKDIPSVFFFLGIMIYRSWQLALLTLVIIPVALVCIQVFGKLNKRAVQERQMSFGELSSELLENMTGMRIVKAFSMERYEVARFEKVNEHLYRNYMRTIFITAISSPFIELIGALAGASIMVYGGYLIREGVITIGDMGSFFLSFFMLNDPVKSLNGFNLKLQEGLASLQRVFVVLDTDPEITEKEDAIAIDAFHAKIEIRIEEFFYEGMEEPTIKDLFLTVNKGEAIAFVGSSGAGKTTLVNLIPRFYDITKGELCIDGHDIRDLKIPSLRNLMAIVTQETILFNDTIANNITYGHPECPESEMLEAAKAANAHDFIQAQPQGYDTVIGEKGVKLSGGQRQRLAIARALLKDAPILILDEATSALDNESEIEVQQAIERLMQNRTTFVIAHRLSTIRNANRICVLENGHLLEMGTHDELLAAKGRYLQLYEMQFQL
ncbi:MAG: ABC transporter ATP-binding protein [SAR324 cluster bacterium]|nr:ABC transporter ATP-binding protein [SAR324 cluster bacterium]